VIIIYCIVDIIDDNDGSESGGHSFHFDEILKCRIGFGAEDDFLDPSRVEWIDKRSIFHLDCSTNRQSAVRAFEWWSNRLDWMGRRTVMDGLQEVDTTTMRYFELLCVGNRIGM